jgi:hypothetical protein
MDGEWLEMRGFTFIEVVLALMLLSFGLLAITGMFGVSSQALLSGGNRTKAVLLAQEKLEQLKDLPYPHDDLTPEGRDPNDLLQTVREDHGPIQLVWYVQKDRPVAGLSILVVEAIWRGSGGQGKSVKFVTLRADFGDGPASGLASEGPGLGGHLPAARLPDGQGGQVGGAEPARAPTDDNEGGKK